MKINSKLQYADGLLIGSQMQLKIIRHYLKYYLGPKLIHKFSQSKLFFLSFPKDQF